MTSDSFGGPYLQMAVICERALQEKDGVLSIIRVIDRFTVTAAGGTAPPEMPSSVISFTIVITLKAGAIHGRYNLKLSATAPSGKTLSELSTGILLEGEDRGVNGLFNLQMPVTEEGLYWFDVSFENQLLTRMPLRLVYQRVSQGQLPGLEGTQ
jgi:hypothetical protein